MFHCSGVCTHFHSVRGAAVLGCNTSSHITYVIAGLPLPVVYRGRLTSPGQVLVSAAACSYVGWNIVDVPCKVYTGGMCSSEHCLVYTRNKIVKEYRVVNVRKVLEQG